MSKKKKKKKTAAVMGKYGMQAEKARLAVFEDASEMRQIKGGCQSGWVSGKAQR